jgi:hypothetical protein
VRLHRSCTDCSDRGGSRRSRRTNHALDQLNIRDFGSFPAVGSQTAELQPWDGRDKPNFATPEAGRYTTRDPGACQRSRGRSFLPDAGAGSVTKLVIPFRLCGGETVRAVIPGPVISRQPDRISTKPLISRASVVSWAPSRGLVVSGGRSDQFDTATNRSTTWSPSSVMSDRPTVTAPSRV